LAKLEEEATQLSEEYNQANIKLSAAKAKLKEIDKDIAAQEEAVGSLHDQAAVVAIQRFQDYGATTPVVLFTSDSQDEALSRIVMAEYVSQTSQSLLQNYQFARVQLDDLRRSQVGIVEDIKKDESRLKTLKTEAEQKVNQAQGVVNRLTAEQRARLEAETSSAPKKGGSSPPPPPVPNGAAAQTVVSWAHARVGKRYCMGGTGPNCWDCSGFTMSAYSQVGVKLPHSASTQYRIGKSVSRNNLQPGDLVFFYGGPGHVGIYVGGGKIIDARNERVGVVYNSINAGMPYTGARRIL
jgi:cell wall-associated NlpC family hydrolase